MRVTVEILLAKSDNYEYDIDGDGELDAEVYSPHLKVGDYLIKVVPKPDALPTDTYSLEIEAAGTTLTLAQGVLIGVL